jgi:amino acid permease
LTNLYARLQAAFLTGWALLWLAGRVLPGGLGRLAYTTRNLLFIFLSAITVWIGYLIVLKNKKMIVFFMAAHIWFVRKIHTPEHAAVLLRNYRRSAVQKQTGQIYLLTGGICLAVGLYYFIF